MNKQDLQVFRAGESQAQGAGRTPGLDQARPDEHPERGASMVEYGLLIALVAVVCIVAIGVLGQKASGKFSGAGRGFDGDAVACTAGTEGCSEAPPPAPAD